MPSHIANPYAGIDWKNQIRLQGATHMHCPTDELFQNALAEGLDFATFSNYYPSLPCCPAASMRKNTARMKLPYYVQNGKLVKQELDYRKFFLDHGATPPADLPEEEGGQLFSNVPPDLLEAPNAEHHYFTDTSVYLHVTAPGSTFVSGRPRFKNDILAQEGIRLGVGMPWREGFSAILDSLVTPDGGGIIVNHPQWSHHPVDFLCEMLDYDERVLGLEVVNTDCSATYTSGAEPQWDAVLSTGRQCWGFCTPDHYNGKEWRGRSILLPEERTVESCLRAYRQGRFYGAIRGQGLSFERIEFDGKTLRVRCDKEAIMLLISSVGVVKELWTGQELTYTLSEGDREKHRFFRVTAEDQQSREKLYTQPIMLV